MQGWFDLGFDWIEVNLSTREPGFYSQILQIHDNTQDMNAFKFFQVPIGNSKCVQNFKFHNDAPMIKYCQKLLNSCFFIILASSFAINKQIKAANYISFYIEESLKSEVVNHMDIANSILKNEKKNLKANRNFIIA